MRAKLISQPSAVAASLNRRGCTTTAATIRSIATITMGSSSKSGHDSDHQPSPIRFGPFEVTSQVFLTTLHSFALVNLKPLLPGHVLVCPRKPHRRLTDLAATELTDLFSAVQRVQRMLARHYFSTSTSSFSSSSSTKQPPETAGSFNIAVQDGPEAGQTVPHVHVHVIPRAAGLGTAAAAGRPDELYERMHGEDGNVGGQLWDAAAAADAAAAVVVSRRRPEPAGAFPPIEDADRAPRSMEEMEAEAGVFRELLRRMAEEEEGEKAGDGQGNGQVIETS